MLFLVNNRISGMSIRGDEVLGAWGFIDPISAMAANAVPAIYKAGSMGPDDTLLNKDGRHWVDPD